jgi:hypothetical protein
MIDARTRVLVLAAAVLSQACSSAPAADMPASTRARFEAAPAAPVRPVTETLHGIEDRSVPPASTSCSRQWPALSR